MSNKRIKSVNRTFMSVTFVKSDLRAPSRLIVSGNTKIVDLSVCCIYLGNI